jgi:uncharacterized membrane protein YphA (DoxX/SURF4 family)/thiol-disulfide isomerase/thioredoxin
VGTAVLAIRIALAAVFAVAGVAKLRDLDGSRQAMRDFGVPASAAATAGLVLPLLELAVAAGLLFPDSARWAAVGALVLLLAFIAGISAALRRGEQPDCHCFGQIHSEPAGPSTLIRNAVLAAFAVVVVAEAPGPSLSDWIGDRTAAELVAVPASVLAVGFGLAWFRLWRERARLHLELSRARRHAMSTPPGIAIGSAAPRFSLERLSGGTVTLDDLLARGRPLLLVFVNPGCESCLELLPSLAQWQTTLSERLGIVMITRGRVEWNEEFFAPYDMDPVLLQKDREVAEDFRIRGTPSAVLITADGKVASNPAETVFGIEPLIRAALNESVFLPEERPVA